MVSEVTTDSQTTSVSQEQDAAQVVKGMYRHGNIDGSTDLARGKVNK